MFTIRNRAPRSCRVAGSARSKALHFRAATITARGFAERQTRDEACSSAGPNRDLLFSTRARWAARAARPVCRSCRRGSPRPLLEAAEPTPAGVETDPEQSDAEGLGIHGTAQCSGPDGAQSWRGLTATRQPGQSEGQVGKLISWQVGKCRRPQLPRGFTSLLFYFSISLLLYLSMSQGRKMPTSSISSKLGSLSSLSTGLHDKDFLLTWQ